MVSTPDTCNTEHYYLSCHPQWKPTFIVLLHGKPPAFHTFTVEVSAEQSPVGADGLPSAEGLWVDAALRETLRRSLVDSKGLSRS